MYVVVEDYPDHMVLQDDVTVVANGSDEISLFIDSLTKEISDLKVVIKIFAGILLAIIPDIERRQFIIKELNRVGISLENLYLS